MVAEYTPRAKDLWDCEMLTERMKAKLFVVVRYIKSKSSTGSARKSRRQAEPPSVEPPVTEPAFNIGDRVTHHMFGDGTVEAVRDHKLRIKFETVGSKALAGIAAVGILRRKLVFLATILHSRAVALHAVEGRDRLLAYMFNSADDRVFCLFNGGLQRSHHTRRLFGFVFDHLLHFPTQRQSGV
jgi:hypothetical protein